MSDQREKILGCACELYLDGGLDGFSMRKLARGVGVTAPALYRHYASKEHVIADVMREAYREFSAHLYRALEGRTPEERLKRAGDGFLDFALAHPRWYRMVFIAPEQLGMTELPEELEAQGCAVHQFWVDRLRECMDAGLLKPAHPESVALTLWAHAHGMLTLYHAGHFRMEESEFRALYAASGRQLMTGLASEAYVAELDRKNGDGRTVTAAAHGSKDEA